MMFLSIIPTFVFVLIIISVVGYFINRNQNIDNMDSNQIIKPKITALDFLLNLFSVISLYVVVGCLFNLLFVVIEKAYPKISTDYFTSQSISWPVAMLIILFPVFVGIIYFLEKGYKTEPEKRNFFVHKWLTYITLFVGGSAIVGDLITVLYYFLDGRELTAGFLLKVLFVLAITLLVFFYYIAEIRNTLNPRKRKIWFCVATAIVLFSIIWGFAVLGSPYTQRLLKYDQDKTSNLMEIDNQIINFYSAKGILPNNLEDLAKGYYDISSILIDRQNEKPYVYEKIGENTYNLCAEFNKVTEEKNMNISYPYGDYITWGHPAGYYCFNKTVNPNLYSKPIPAY